jgi:hypothetical protein
VATYTAAFSSSGFLDPNGYRFSTAFELSARLFSLEFEGVNPPGAIDACKRQCTILSDCLGFFYHVRFSDVRCYGLNDLGNKVRTSSTGFSFVKAGVEIPSLTTTQGPSTFSTDGSTTARATTADATTTAAAATTVEETTTLTPQTTVIDTTSSETTAAAATSTDPTTSSSSCAQQIGFDLALAGNVACNAGSSLRFNTALNSDFVIARFEGAGASDCFEACLADDSCAGVFFWTTSANINRCNTLTDVGSPTGTTLKGYSYSKSL